MHQAAPFCAILFFFISPPIVSQPVKVELSEGQTIPDNMEVYRLQGAKPDYEVGSSAQLKLSFASKAPGIICALQLLSGAVGSVLKCNAWTTITLGSRWTAMFGLVALDPTFWNSLPQDLRHCSSLSSFEARLKTFLFSQYFHPSQYQYPVSATVIVCMCVVHVFVFSCNTLCKLFW